MPFLPTPASALARFEIRRFRGLLPRVALAFVLCVPLLYSAIYLSANWDPYGKLDRLPVALVNQDQPATFQDKEIHAGADFVESMHEKATFDFQDVSAARAAEGLAQGDFYLTVTVPATFSADLVSGAGDAPRRAEVELRRNDANGFVVGSIVGNAQNAITVAVDEAVEEAYFEAVFANLATIRTSLEKATEGAGELEAGLAKADAGSGTLAEGAASASEGAEDLAAGATALSTGLATAKTGSADLAAGLGRLKTGSAQVSSGAEQVAGGTQQLADAVVPVLTDVEKELPRVQQEAATIAGHVDRIADAVSGGGTSLEDRLTAAVDDLDQLVADNPRLQGDPTITRLRDALSTAADNADDISRDATAAKTTVDAVNSRLQNGDLAAKVTGAKKKVTDLNTGAQKVADGAAEVSSGASSAAAGAGSLATGVAAAATGAADLSTGATTLSDGLTTLKTGAADLHTGLGTLHTGAGTLHDSLADGVARLPALTEAEKADAVQVLSSPADVRLHVDNPAVYYGRGLAPMFFAIALWVFGVSVFLVVRPISGRALAGRARPLRLALTGWLPIGAIAVLAGWLMVAVVWVTLGLAPVHAALLLLVVTLGAVCFSAIAHLLRTTLGTAGTSILLVWLILQLASTGGTYPAPLLPGFYAAISHIMPMTYLIDAFRVTISGGLMSHLLRDVAVLGVGAVFALALCVLVVARRQRFTMTDLHPQLVAP